MAAQPSASGRVYTQLPRTQGDTPASEDCIGVAPVADVRLLHNIYHRALVATLAASGISHSHNVAYSFVCDAKKA